MGEPLAKKERTSRRYSKKALPGHVEDSLEQLHRMESAIRTLLGPFVDRLNIFLHPSAERILLTKKKRKKQNLAK